MANQVNSQTHLLWSIAEAKDKIDNEEQEAQQYRRLLSIVLSRLDRMAAQVNEETSIVSRSSKSSSDSEETDNPGEQGPVKSVRFRVNGAVTEPEKTAKQVIDCDWKVLLDAAFFGNKGDSMKRYQSAVQRITQLQEDYEAAVSERDAMLKNTRLTSQKVRALESDNVTLRDVLFKTHEEKEEYVVELSMERNAAEESVSKLTADLESTQKELKRLTEEKKMAVDQEIEAQDKLRRMRGQIDKMDEQLNNALTERDRVLDENVVTLSKCGELSQTAAISKKERDQLADEKRILEVRLKSFQEEFDQMVKSRDGVERIRLEKEELDAKLENLQSEYNMLKDQYEWSLNECSKAMSKSEALRKDVRSLALSRDNLLAERDEAREELYKSKAQEIVLRNELQTLKAELENANGKLSLLRSVMESPKLKGSSESLLGEASPEKQAMVGCKL